MLDARIGRRAGTLVPAPAPSWSAQVPPIGDHGRRDYVRQIAALMDARKERIGEHAAASTLPWAVTLGPVPGGPAARLEWQQRAAAIGAYRELSGYQHPADPIGPEPPIRNPELCAAWHEALAALGPAGGPDVRGMTDGLLLRLRDTYPVETAWAPPWTGEELRQARAAARDAHLAAVRSAAEATAARRRGDHNQATRQQALAASYEAMHDAYQERETVFAATMTDRADWEHSTRRQRHLAVAADAELRRRHPGQPWLPLRSAEPEFAPAAQPGVPALMPDENLEQAAQLISDLAARHREFAARLAGRQSVMMLEDSEFEDSESAFPSWAAPGRGAILQPPKPEIQPSERILERIADHDRDMEAAG